jgi:Ca2+-binding RTX toxin-like protein
MEGRSTSGEVYIHNTGHLIVGGVSAGADGFVAAGEVVLMASSPVTITESIKAADIHIVAMDDDIDGTAATNDDLIVEDGVVLNATAGNVTLCAGDDLLVSTGATLMATGNIILTGDCGDADDEGSTISLLGTIEATTLIVNGNGDDDTIVITHLAENTPAFINLGDGDDQLLLGSKATPSSNEGGVAEGMLSLLTVNGGGGIDTLSVDDSGDITDQVATVTSTFITGLGLAEGIAYAGIERLDIALGSGNDLINVQSTLEGTTTTITSNDGDDTFNISSDAPANQGTLDGIAGELILDGGQGDNILNISDRGNDAGRTGIVIDENGISGLGGATGTGTIQYTASGTFAGGLNYLLGDGDDGITILGASDNTVTTLRTGGGDDSVILRNESSDEDGLVVIFGEAGSDSFDGHEWDNDLILFGDEGQAIYSGLMRPENLTELLSQPGSDDGHDTLIGGTGDDLIIGGMGNDELQGGDGNDQLIGDLGRANYSAGELIQIESTELNIGGNDRINGGAGDDAIIGGMGADKLYGAAGNDAIIGDAGRIIYQLTELYQVENTQLFTGGDDLLDGGNGNDILFGGFGHDTFYGTFGEDIILGEEGRLTLNTDGTIDTLIRMGQSPQGLIASSQERLYTMAQPQPDSAQDTITTGEGVAAVSTELAQLNITVDPQSKHRYHHAGSHVVPQQQTIAEEDQDVVIDAENQDTVIEDKAPHALEAQPLEPKETAPEAPIQPGAPEKDQLDQSKSPVEENEDTILNTMHGAVLGLTGWGVATGERKGSKKRLESDALHRFGQPQARSWRWQQGRLQQEGKVQHPDWKKPLVQMTTFNTQNEPVETQQNL